MEIRLPEKIEREILARCISQTLYSWLSQVLREKREELSDQSWDVLTELLTNLKRRSNGEKSEV